MTEAQPLHPVARTFVGFCLLMALLGLISFRPPKSPAIVAWLLVWTTICLGTAFAIMRRVRYAPILVWSLLALAGYSAVSLFLSGSLGAIGVVIDIVLFIPLIWFALWYQRRQRLTGPST